MAESEDVSNQLARLAQMHSAGDLDDDEFAAAKRKILGPSAIPAFPTSDLPGAEAPEVRRPSPSPPAVISIASGEAAPDVSRWEVLLLSVFDNPLAVIHVLEQTAHFDGIRAAAIVREVNHSSPVVITTGVTGGEASSLCAALKAAGANAKFQKAASAASPTKNSASATTLLKSRSFMDWLVPLDVPNRGTSVVVTVLAAIVLLGVLVLLLVGAFADPSAAGGFIFFIVVLLIAGPLGIYQGADPRRGKGLGDGARVASGRSPKQAEPSRPTGRSVPSGQRKVVTVNANASSIHKRMHREIAKQERQGWSVVSAQVENSGWMVPSATIVLKR